MNLDIVTKFGEARDLIQQAFNIFHADLRSLEGNKSTSTRIAEEVSVRNDHDENTSTKNSDREHNKDGIDCDIKNLDIRIEISAIKEVYQHLEMDESYDLKVTSKYNRRADYLFFLEYQILN